MLQTATHMDNPNLALLLADLQRAGVTDIVAEDEFTYFNADPIAKVVKPAVGKELTAELQVERPVPVQQGNVEKVVSKTVESVSAKVASSPVKTKKTNPDDHVWSIEGGEKVTVIVGTLAEKGQIPLTDDEMILFEKMLGCIDVKMTDVNFVALKEETENGSIAKPDIPGIKTKLEEEISTKNANNVLLVGVEVCSILTGNMLSKVRNMDDIKICEKAASALYHPKILLKQPAFKRAAWQDLLNFQKQLGNF